MLVKVMSEWEAFQSLGIGDGDILEDYFGCYAQLKAWAEENDYILGVDAVYEMKEEE